MLLVFLHTIVYLKLIILIQIVTYYADDEGYHADVKYEGEPHYPHPDHPDHKPHHDQGYPPKPLYHQAYSEPEHNPVSVHHPTSVQHPEPVYHPESVHHPKSEHHPNSVHQLTPAVYHPAAQQPPPHSVYKSTIKKISDLPSQTLESRSLESSPSSKPTSKPSSVPEPSIIPSKPTSKPSSVPEPSIIPSKIEETDMKESAPLSVYRSLPIRPTGFPPGPKVNRPKQSYSPTPTYAPKLYTPAPNYSPKIYTPTPVYAPKSYTPTPNYAHKLYTPAPTYHPKSYTPAPIYKSKSYSPAPYGYTLKPYQSESYSTTPTPAYKSQPTPSYYKSRIVVKGRSDEGPTPLPKNPGKYKPSPSIKLESEDTIVPNLINY